MDDSFSIADLMMGFALEIARRLGVLDDLPSLVAYQACCFDRPALRRAVEDQREQSAAHEMADMRYGDIVPA